MSAPPKKTLIEVHQASYKNLKTQATKSGHTIKSLATILLDYALQGVSSGRLLVRSPGVTEASTQKGGRPA